MAVTYTWSIPTVERNLADGGVTVCHWRCTGVDDAGNSASSYGTCGLTYDASASDFTPYADITESQAQGWVWGHVSQADTEAAIASKIDAIANPTTAAGVPW
jgi:hypothetical protein